MAPTSSPRSAACPSSKAQRSYRGSVPRELFPRGVRVTRLGAPSLAPHGAKPSAWRSLLADGDSVKVKQAMEYLDSTSASHGRAMRLVKAANRINGRVGEEHGLAMDLLSTTPIHRRSDGQFTLAPGGSSGESVADYFKVSKKNSSQKEIFLPEVPASIRKVEKVEKVKQVEKVKAGAMTGGSSFPTWHGHHIHFLLDLIDRKERSLECPVCMEEAAAPIYGCPQQFHILCQACRAEGLPTCPTCRLPYGKEGAVRNRFAEEAAGEVARLREELAKVTV